MQQARPTATAVATQQAATEAAKAKEKAEKEIILTRSGYEVSEAFHAYQTALTEAGATAIGKALHFAADLVCSGGVDLWMKVAWDHAIFHIGLASPRIFVYLKKRFTELDAFIKKYPQESLYTNDEFQTRIAEVVHVLNGCPRRAPVKWPPVGAETHTEGWLRAVKQAPEVAAVNRIWKQDADSYSMRIAACEIVKSMTDGATERSLFWLRWLLEEDSLWRKNNLGLGLSSMERGPAHFSQKKRTDPGFFILAILAEVYKELAAKQLVRMHEEFQCLIDLWRGPAIEVPLTQKQRRELLGIMILLISEVPRWKVPAAPALVKDPVQLSRAVSQSDRFFTEVLVYPPVSRAAVKAGAKKKVVGKKINDLVKKQMNLEEHLAAYDSVVNTYLGLD
jgi:hypothetical protein